MKNPRYCSPVKAPGFTLVEVIVALGIFVFAITALMGVMPYGMQQVQTASHENFAISTMEGIRDDLSLALRTKMTNSLRYGITPPDAGATTSVDMRIMENGEIAGPNQAAALRVKGTIRQPAATAPGPCQLHLRTTWPANALAGKETGAIELIAAYLP